MNSYGFKMILTSVFVSLTACSALVDKFMKSPEVNVDRVEIRDPELTKANLIFVLKVKNPNSYEIKVDEVSYTVDLAGEHFATAKRDQAVVLKGKAETFVELPLPVDYSKLFKGISSLLQNKAMTYKIEGNAKLSAISVPFKEEGKVEL